MFKGFSFGKTTVGATPLLGSPEKIADSGSPPPTNPATSAATLPTLSFTFGAPATSASDTKDPGTSNASPAQQVAFVATAATARDSDAEDPDTSDPLDPTRPALATKSVSFDLVADTPSKGKAADAIQPSGAGPTATGAAGPEAEQEATSSASDSTVSAQDKVVDEDAAGNDPTGAKESPLQATDGATVQVADLSPNDALVLRIVFGAILRQESLLNDAIMCSTFLKFGSQIDLYVGDGLNLKYTVHNENHLT